MVRLSNLVLVLCFVMSSFVAKPQKLYVNFGDISRADLEMTVYKPDPTASAVVLSDIGSAVIEYIGDDFQIVLERNVRIKILNKNGFDYANFEIAYFTNDKLLRVQASTYNLVNDTIVETKVDKRDFISDKTSKYTRKMVIAFPNVNEGSIVECQYRYVTKSIYSYVPWHFQADIPKRYTDFTAEYADIFNYRGIIRGDATLITRRSESKNTYIAGYSTTASVYRWVGSNIPAFKDEPYITGVSDHLIRLEFELVGVNFPGGGYKVFTPTYKELSKKLLDRQDFGIALSKTSFLKSHTMSVISGATSDLEKLKRIHTYVSNKILWDGDEDFTASETLKKVFNNERGNSADINLILIAMLRQAGLKVDPVILSTRSNGSLHPIIAMIQQFNYVIAHVEIGGKVYLVDATDPLRPFNTLPFECLNHQGWLVHLTNAKWVDLSNKEKDVYLSSVNISIEGDGKVLGEVQNSYLGNRAFRKRKFLKIRSLKGYNDNIRVSNPSWDISNFELQNADSIQASLNEKYSVNISDGAQVFPSGLIINPYLFTSALENPFTSEERKFTIDFGCPFMSIYTIKIAIPQGYTVDEKPASLSVKLPENAGSFLYSCEQQGDILTVQSKFSIDQIRFKAEEYKILREFFAQVYRKQSELIVLKKKEI